MKTFHFFNSLFLLVLITFMGCKSDKTEGSKNLISDQVNVYSHRYYDADRDLFDRFEKQTGIKVNVKNDSDDKLIQLLQAEGSNSECDVLITVDAGRLYMASELGLLAKTTSKILEKNIPKKYRSTNQEWLGLTKRARIMAYSKERVDTSKINSYWDLVNPEWKGKVAIRSAQNIYNQSLLANIISLYGEDSSKVWASGVVNNFCEPPSGNDRDQIKKIALGKADLAVVNTYYYGKLMNSSNELEQDAASKVGLLFPKEGTHINISGAGITKNSPNRENALKLLEFLSDVEAQEVYATANFEMPVNQAAKYQTSIQTPANFKELEIDFEEIGKLNAKAVEVFHASGWK